MPLFKTDSIDLWNKFKTQTNYKGIALYIYPKWNIQVTNLIRCMIYPTDKTIREVTHFAVQCCLTNAICVNNQNITLKLHFKFVWHMGISHRWQENTSVCFLWTGSKRIEVTTIKCNNNRWFMIYCVRWMLHYFSIQQLGCPSQMFLCTWHWQLMERTAKSFFTK